MKRQPKIGEIGETEFVVAAQHAIDFADERMPAVLSTPWLVWFLEHSARAAMLPLLEEHESTVGIVVDVEHLAPTPLGQKVVCTSRIIHTDGPIISFQMEAHDEQERIARGLHKLSVIDMARFKKRVERKAQK